MPGCELMKGFPPDPVQNRKWSQEEALRWQSQGRIKKSRVDGKRRPHTV